MSKSDHSRISVLEASRVYEVSRATLYKYIKAGKITPDKDGRVDAVDLSTLFSPRPIAQAIDKKKPVNDTQDQALIHLLERENTLLQNQVDLLTRQLQALSDQIARLTTLLEHSQATASSLAEKVLALPVGRRSGSAATQQRNECGKFVKATPEKQQGTLLQCVDRTDGRS